MSTKLVALWRAPVRRPLLAAAATVGSLALLSGTASAYPTNPATIWTIAGNGSHCASSTTTCGDGTSATSAQLNEPNGVAVDGAGNVYIADTNDNKIRKLTPAGAISTIAGDGNTCASPSTTTCGDGPTATSAQLSEPTGVALDGAGNVYIADANDHKIRKLTPSGAISTIAGDGNTCASPSTTTCGDGPTATSAQLNQPEGVAVDGAGNVYIADSADNKIRKLTPTGAISTIAGNGSPCASPTTSCGDGATATSAQLNFPTGVALDGAGNVYIADQNDNKIRKLTPAGAISTIAGTGNTCGSPSTTTCGDGATATSAQLSFPSGVAVDGAGNVYIADQSDNKIRELTAGGTIGTLAGDGTACANSPFCGDGEAGRSAELNEPYGVAVDQAGRNVFIADTFDNLVRWLAGPQAGPQGPQGPQAGQGPRGAPGPRGRPGRDARVTCKVKKSKKTKKVKVTCKVKYVSSKALAAELVRHGRVYARGHVGRRGVVRLHATHALHRGRYTLVVRTRGAHHRTAVARVQIRI
ncbi:MAG: hypothetical protein E6G00_13565 [Actinobacteria bacterium]|nr:MAG: hypothetical protein E6G00_13565 [Actinomycetota bacterium]